MTYPQQPAHTQPPKRRGLHPMAIVGIVLGSVLVLCCIGGGAFVLLSSDDGGSPGAGGNEDGDGGETAGIGDSVRDGK